MTQDFDSKDLTKGTISDKILKEKASEIARNCNYDGYQRVFWYHRFFDKKTWSGITVNKLLAEQLHKPVKNSKEEKSMQD